MKNRVFSSRDVSTAAGWLIPADAAFPDGAEAVRCQADPYAHLPARKSAHRDPLCARVIEDAIKVGVQIRDQVHFRERVCVGRRTAILDIAIAESRGLQFRGCFVMC